MASMENRFCKSERMIYSVVMMMAVMHIRKNCTTWHEDRSAHLFQSCLSWELHAWRGTHIDRSQPLRNDRLEPLEVCSYGTKYFEDCVQDKVHAVWHSACAVCKFCDKHTFWWWTTWSGWIGVGFSLLARVDEVCSLCLPALKLEGRPRFKVVLCSVPSSLLGWIRLEDAGRKIGQIGCYDWHIYLS
jgi:hypothetical protein